MLSVFQLMWRLTLVISFLSFSVIYFWRLASGHGSCFNKVDGVLLSFTTFRNVSSVSQLIIFCLLLQFSLPSVFMEKSKFYRSRKGLVSGEHSITKAARRWRENQCAPPSIYILLFALGFVCDGRLLWVSCVIGVYSVRSPPIEWDKITRWI